MKLLKEHDWEVHVAARDNLAEKNGLQLEYPDKVFNLPFERNPWHKNNRVAYRHLKQIIDDGHYAVVHCNTPVGGVLGRLAAREARKKGTKVFYTAHGFHFYKGAPLGNWLFYYPIEKWMGHFTDILITITHEDFDIAMRNFSCKVAYIHGVGADASRFYPLPEAQRRALRTELGYSEDEKLILCTGELLPNKNQITAIRAMSGIIATVPTAKLLLAGNGPMLPKLQEEVARLDLESHVQFLGYRIDIEKFVNISDVVISCSFREGLPMNIVEAMLCQKPVIASYNRGHRELVRDGKNGFLFSPDDSNALSTKAIELLIDSLKAKQLAKDGFDFVYPFSNTQVTLELQGIYQLQ